MAVKNKNDDEVICGIYEIVNIKNNKKYIGQSIDIKERWKRHKYELNTKIHFNEHLQNAWDKYGEESFQFNILEVCSSELLDERECFYIDMYDAMNPENGYNLKNGGNGLQVSDESRAKMSEAQKNRWTEEQKKELSLKYLGENNPFYGKHHTKETGQKIANANKKRVWSNESRKKTSESSKGRKSPNKGKATPQSVKEKISQSLKGRPSTKKLPVVQLTKEEEYIKSFNSMTEAALETGILLGSISKCCLGDQKTAGGFIWKKENEYLQNFNFIDGNEEEPICN